MPSIRSLARAFERSSYLFCILLLQTCSLCFATTPVGTVNIGAPAYSVAVNPVTNKAYVGNGSQLVIIDGATSATTLLAISVGANCGIAVNPVTNKIYATTTRGNTLYVVDGATNAITTIPVGSGARAVAVNSVTNTIYVGNYTSGTVSVVNGNTTSVTATVTVGTNPLSIGIDPILNEIYVVNNGSGTATVIDGATNNTHTFTTGAAPLAIAVNPNTGTAYVANSGANTVTILSGASVTGSFATGTDPLNIAVNPITNMVYTSNFDGSFTAYNANTAQAQTTTVTDELVGVVVNTNANVIYFGSVGQIYALDVASGTVTQITVGLTPQSLAFNPVTNHLFVGNQGAQSVSIVDCSKASTVTGVTVGQGADAIAVNPITHTAYVANKTDGTVTVISNSLGTSTVTVGSNPTSVALNIVTNKIYVTNFVGTPVGTLSVIDGATKTVTATVSVGTSPIAVKVNPVTNTIYVANEDSNGTVSVINGSTLGVTTVAVGSNPSAIAINPVTNKIYVTNSSSNTVTVIDGWTNITSTINVGTSPVAVAVNPVTNKVYVANNNSSTVTVIDVANNNATSTVNVGSQPIQIEVNPANGFVYIADLGGNTVTYIDPSNVATTFAQGTSNGGLDTGLSVGVNPATNHVYAGSAGASDYSIIDGATNAAVTLSSSPSPGINVEQIGIDHSNGRIYFPSSQRTTMDILTENSSSSVAITTSLAYVPDAGLISSTNFVQTENPAPSFTATVTNPYHSATTAVYYQVDSQASKWTRVVPSGNSASFTLPTQSFGLHFLYAFAAYGGEAALDGSTYASGSSPVTGAIARIPFFIDFIPTTTSVTTSQSPQLTGNSITFSAKVTPTAATGSITFYDTFGTTMTVLGTGTVTNGVATLLTSSITSVGTHTITSEYSGDTQYGGSFGNVSQQIYVPDSTTTTVTANPSTITIPASTTITAVVTDPTNPTTIPTGSATFTLTENGQTSTLGNAVTLAADGSASITYTPTASDSQSITATYTTDNSVATYGSVGSATLTVLAAGTFQQTITFPQPASPAAVNANVTLAATASSGLPITYTLLSGPATITGTTLKMLFPGTAVVQASQAGNSTYLPATSVQRSVVAYALGNVSSRSQTQTATLTITTAGTLGQINVLTQGAASQDFAFATGGTCATGTAYTVGQTCTVRYSFTPSRPGIRLGSVNLTTGSSSTATVLGSLSFAGIGTGPLVTYPAAATWLSIGSGFSQPRGIAIDGSGDIFVADQSNNAVKEIIATSGVVSSASTVITVGSGFTSPNGVAIDGNGNVFVADGSSTGVKEILAVNGAVSSTSTVIPIATGITSPLGIAVDASGDVFVADSTNNAVKEIIPVNGSVSVASPIVTIGSGFSVPLGLAVDTNGNVFVADGGNGAVKEIVAVNGAVSSTSTVNTIGSGYNKPEGVAVDAVGDVFVADHNTNLITEILAVSGSVSSSSTVTTLLGSGFSSPQGIGVDGNGHVFVLDVGHSAVLTEIDMTVPPALSFANTPINAISSDSPQTVTVRNAGNATLSLASIATSTTDFAVSNAGSCGATLTTTTACTIAVTFNPQQTGARTAGLLVTNNTLSLIGSQQTGSLSSTGTGMTAQTITFTTLPSTAHFGDIANLSATSTSGLTVQFSIVSRTSSTSISGGQITFGDPGTVVVAADQPGDATYASATRVTQTITILQNVSTLTWTPPANIVYMGIPIGTAMLNAHGSVTGTITYTAQLLPSGTPQAITATSTLNTSGTYQFTATLVPTDISFSTVSTSVTITVPATNLFVLTSAGGEYVLDGSGNAETTGVAGGGIGAAVDSSGSVWSINLNGTSISKFSDTGSATASFSNVNLSSATALAIDGDSNIWVTNGSGGFTELSNAGAVKFTSTSSNYASPSSVAVDLSGSVWVSNAADNTVVEVIGAGGPAAPIATAASNFEVGARP